MRLEAGCCSDRGDRPDNEDRAEILAGGCVCLVADGMGGPGGGGVASRLAVETVREAVASGTLEVLAGEPMAHQRLAAIFGEANQRILAAAQGVPRLEGLGTTLTLALISEDRLYFAHVGDTRLYLCQRGHCELLTEDHNQAREFTCRGWFSAAEAAHSRYRNILTRCLGTIASATPQFGARVLQAGDRLLICSDGLYVQTPQAHLDRLLSEDRSARELAAGLVAAAKERGRAGLDNITALVIRVDD